MTGSGPQHAAAHPGRRRRLADVGISAKVAIAVGLPLAAVVGLGAVVGGSSALATARVGQARDLVALAAQASPVVRALQQERLAAVLLLQSPPGDRPAATAFTASAAATDTAVATYRQRRAAIVVSGVTADAVTRVDDQLAELAGLRSRTVTQPGPSVTAAAFSYRITIAALLDLRQAVAVADVPPALANQIRASAALSQAAESLSLEQVAVLRAVSTGVMSPAVQGDLLAARAGYTDAFGQFTALGDPAWPDWYAATVAGPAVVTAESTTGQVTGTAAGQPVRLDLGPWLAATSTRGDLIATVQCRVDTVVAAATQQLQRTAAVQSALIVALVAVVVLLAALVTIAVGRHLSRRLRILRVGSRQVSTLLQDTVTALADQRQRDPAQVVHEATSRVSELVAVDGQDEIGAVAATVAQVVTEAMRLASDQTLLRTDSTARTIAVARRVRQHADRLIRILDGLEREELDSDRLAQIFDLDHLLTVTLRFTDGLLVLAGVSPAPVHTQPSTVGAVLKAGQSRVREYKRIVISQVPEVAIRADAVHHLAHLFAELMDNATAYSPPPSPVTVHAGLVGDRVVVQIHDLGVGIDPADLDAYNTVLAGPRPPTSPQQIGLAVVAALASWTGTRVELRPDPGGLIAEVTIPAHQLEPAPPRPAPDAPLTRPAPPVHQGAPLVPGQRSPAAALPAGPAAPGPIRAVPGADRLPARRRTRPDRDATSPQAAQLSLDNAHLEPRAVAATLSAAASALSGLHVIPAGFANDGPDTVHLPLTPANGVPR